MEEIQQQQFLRFLNKDELELKKYLKYAFAFGIIKKAVIFVLLFSNYSFAQSLFKEIDKKDEFGDVVGTQLVNVSEGIFSNSATQNQFLVAKVTYQKAEENPTYEEFVEDKLNNDLLLKSDSKMARKWWVKKKSKNEYDAKISFVGNIHFDFFQYDDLQPYVPIDRTSIIKLKFSDGTKADLNLLPPFPIISIRGYKKLSFEEPPHMGNRKYRNTIIGEEVYWDSFIVEKIANSKEPIEVVVYNGLSKFQFTMKPTK